MILKKVCRGTGTESITGSNGNRFAMLVCQKMGFSHAEFNGGETNYRDFLKEKYSLNSQFNTSENSECLPGMLRILKKYRLLNFKIIV